MADEKKIAFTMDKELLPNPYRDSGPKLEVWRNGWFEVRRDCLTKKIVQSGYEQSAQGWQLEKQMNEAARASEPLPMRQLREIALSTIAKHDPSFEKRRAGLHPLEDNHNGIRFYFRWDDFSAPIRNDDLPPFVQVAILRNGYVYSYTNTLR